MLKTISGIQSGTFTVTIHRNADTDGYWAECHIGDGCCYTDGMTIHETQKNMYESVDLYLEDYADITDYSLTFDVRDA